MTFSLLVLCVSFDSISKAQADRPWRDAPVPVRLLADHTLSAPVESAMTALPDGTLYSLDTNGILQRIDLVDGRLYPMEGTPSLTTITANTQGLWGITRQPKFELLNISPNSGSLINTVSLDTVAHSNSYFVALQIARDKAYFADDTNPALITVDLNTDFARRLLEGAPSLSAHAPLRRAGKTVTTPDGILRTGGNIQFIALDHTKNWLFYQTPTGPLYRIATSLLIDETVSPAELIEGMANWRRTPSLGGLTITAEDVIYMVDIDHGDLLAFGADRIPLRLLHDDRLTQAHNITLLPKNSKADARLAVLLQQENKNGSIIASHIVEIGLP